MTKTIVKGIKMTVKMAGTNLIMTKVVTIIAHEILSTSMIGHITKVINSRKYKMIKMIVLQTSTRTTEETQMEQTAVNKMMKTAEAKLKRAVTVASEGRRPKIAA